MYNSSNRERTTSAEPSPAMIGRQQRTILQSRKKEEVSHREESLLTAEIPPKPLTTHLNTFTVLLNLSSIALWYLDPAGALRVLHSYISVHRGRCSVVSLQLTCGCELLQVWNMAATETQLMLSVGLIGESQFTSRFLFLGRVFKRGFRLSVRAGQSHDTSVTQKCLISRAPCPSLLLYVMQYAWMSWSGICS